MTDTRDQQASNLTQSRQTEQQAQNRATTDAPEKKAMNKNNVDTMTPEQKRALLAKLMAKKKAEQARKSQLQDKPQNTAKTTQLRRFPLSPAQLRMWFVERLCPDQVAYNMPIAVRLRGQLNVPLVERVMNQLIVRHEILRTRYLEHEGEPQQVIDPKLVISVPSLHLFNPEDEPSIEQSLSDSELETALYSPLRQLVSKPFDLQHGPLLRASLLRIHDEDHVLALVLHHIVMDFNSLEILLRDFAVLYHQQNQQQNPPATEALADLLPPLTIQYADYAQWLQQQQTQQEAHLSYWLRQLADAPHCINLALDYPRPSIQRFAGARINFSFERSDYQALIELGQAQQATPFMSMMASFAIVLHQYSGDRDICIGSTMSNRERPELRNVVGMFVNTLVHRYQIDPKQDFASLLEQVKQTALEAYQHQSVSYEQVVDGLALERELSINALFQVMFNLHSAEQSSKQLPGLTLNPVEFTNQSSRFDLSVDLYDLQDAQATDSINGFIEYNCDLFAPQTIQAIIQSWQTLLAQLAKQQRLSQTQAVAKSPIQQLIAPANFDTRIIHGPSAVNKPASSVLAMLEEAAHQHDENALAIICGEHQIAYSTLHQQANQLARYLQDQGAGPGTRIGICVERGDQALLAILAVIKTGAAYVPMDTSYPAQRLRYMAHDAKLRLLLCDSQHSQTLAVNSTADNATVDSAEQPLQTATIDQALEAATAYSGAPLEDVLATLEACADSPLYMIYTSGSSGKPKAASVYHRNAVNLLDWYINSLEITAADKTLIISALGFDLTQKNLLAPLIAGACVVFKDEPDYDVERISQLIETQQISLLNCAPAAFYPLAEDTQASTRLASLRALMLGGEAIQLGRLSSWLSSSKTQLYNHYGPTECADIACVYAVTAEDIAAHNNRAKPQQRLPIGQPIQQVQLAIVDPETLNPLPQGVAGELLISGAGLGGGYFERPELNQSQFIDWPSTQADLANKTQSWYRSGDIVRQNHQGQLEFIRRKDAQIKLRGLRIELEEVEAQLQQIVGEQAVAVHVCKLQDKAQQDQEQLVAFVAGQPALNEETLFARLGEFLPAYMVPSTLLVLESLPLGANGKLDRQALAQHFAQHQASQLQNKRHQQKPQTSTECLLADIWCEVLNLTEVFSDDHFFHLGGNSILAAKVIARLQPTFEVQMPVRSLFETQRLGAFASLIDQTLKQAADPAPNQERNSHASQASQAHSQLIAQPESAPKVLSYAQQRQWTLAQLEPDNPFYNMPGAINIHGPLDIERLKTAFMHLMQRQAILRSRYESEQGVAKLVISESLPLPFVMVDLSDTADNSQDDNVLRFEQANTGPQAKIQQRLEAALLEQSRIPFDLSLAPLIRINLYKTGHQRYTLLVVMHHIIGDALSNTVLMRDLLALYSALEAQDLQTQDLQQNPALIAPLLTPLRLQYSDYAAWQRNLDFTGQIQYWQQQLADAPALLELPTDYQRPAQQRFDGATVRFNLSHQASEALRQFSQAQDATLFMTLLSAFKVLLMRYSNQDDVLVGIPIAHRPHPALEDVMGMFLNTLVIRSHLQAGQDFKAFLAQVRHTTLAAYENQDAPFEHVVDALDIERSWSHNPVFQAMFIFKEHDDAPLTQLGDLSWQARAVEDNNARVDLALVMNNQAQGISGKLEYRCDLFKPQTIEYMAEVLCHLLEQLPHSQQNLMSMDLLPAAQAQQLHDWNQSAYFAAVAEPLAGKEPSAKKEPSAESLKEPALYDAIKQMPCLHDFYQYHAQLQPQANAIVDTTQAYTFGQLQTAADNISHALLEQGVSRGDRVGILLQRDVSLLAAILGTLQIGAAYVPLDPAYPEARLGYIADHAQFKALISQTVSLSGISVDSPLMAIPSLLLEQIALDQALAQTQQQAIAAAKACVKPSDVAYIIYTSGSTGQPKGVAIEHHSAVTLIQWACGEFSLAQCQGVLAATSICFDLSIFELFLPQALGQEIILAEDVFALLDHPQRERVTLINTVPTAATELLRLDAIPKRASTINLAGEAVPPSLIQALYQQPHIAQVFNLYGPSEDTTYSTWTKLEPSEFSHAAGQAPTSAASIGRPIAKTCAYVLDSQLQAVPIGMPGELYLSGDGLARGYWQSEQLSQASFIANPFAEDFANEAAVKRGFDSGLKSGLESSLKSSLKRMYKTSDRVRMRANGELEFLGRMDNLVKLRGFRVELGEIEAVLHALDEVNQAVAVVNQSGPSARLIAYVTPINADPDTGADADISSASSEAQAGFINSLKAALKERLPDYMQPSQFVVLAKLPRLPNGKLNRKALPEPAPQAEVKHLQQQSLSEVESLIAASFKRLLQLELVNLDDNFFELGGDSILVIQLVASLREHGLQYAPKDVFQYPTLGGLASIADKRKLANIDQSAVYGDILLNPIQHWFFAQNFAQASHWNQSILLKAEQDLDTQALDKALRALCEQHDMLRTRFSFDAQHNAKQTVLKPDDFSVPLQLIEQTSESATSTIEAICAQLQSSLDLHQGPLWQCAYLRIQDQHSQQYQKRLLLSFHHLLIDGVSWRILISDFMLAYQQAVQGLDIALSPKTNSYALWNQRLKRATLDGSFDQEQAYWQTIDQAKPALLSPDDANGSNTMADNAALDFELSEDLTQRLLHDVPKQYSAVVNDALLAALLWVMARHTGDQQLKLYLESHGRSSIFEGFDHSRTLGWFTSLYPLLLSCDALAPIQSNTQTTAEPSPLINRAIGVHEDLGELMKAVKQALRAVPNDGIGYGVLNAYKEVDPRLSRAKNSPSDAKQAAQIRFNYLGQTDGLLAQQGLFSPAHESSGALQGANNHRDVLFDINVLVRQGRLRVQWNYSQAQFKAARIQSLLDDYEQALSALIEFCTSDNSDAGLIAADFPHMQLDDDEMDDLFASL